METNEREQKVLGYYGLTNLLKDLIRKGWLDWNVSRERIESVAEHVYGAQQLAIAMQNIYHYNIDLYKVIFMLAVHELEETKIKDLTYRDISREEKRIMGHQAVQEIIEAYGLKQSIEELIFEFDERKTDEAKFSYMCDKLECDLQSKLYDEEGCVDLDNPDNLPIDKERVARLKKEGKSWSDMWMEFGREHVPFDRNFRSVSEYAQKNNLHILRKVPKK